MNDPPTTDARLTNIETALGTLQVQIDALGVAGDARTASAQHALDDLREIVCDPVNPRNHEGRLTTVEARQSQAAPRSALESFVPSPETVGAYGANIGKWGWKAVAMAALATIFYMFLTGTLVTRFKSFWEIMHPPVRVEVEVTGDPQVQRNSDRLDTLESDTTRRR